MKTYIFVRKFLNYLLFLNKQNNNIDKGYIYELPGDIYIHFNKINKLNISTKLIYTNIQVIFFKYNERNNDINK